MSAYHSDVGAWKGRAGRVGRSDRRPGTPAVLSLMVGMAVAPVAQARDHAPTIACSSAGGEAVRATSLGEDGSVTLADGRSVRLAGIEPSDAAALAAEDRARLTKWVVGRPATLVPTAAGIDRWGRLDGLLFIASGDASAGDSPSAGLLSVAFALVDAGLVRGRPDEGSKACWPALRAAETAARIAGLGLWRDAAYAIRHPEDSDRLDASFGTMVLVEGQVTRVARGRSRLFIALGARGRDVTVSIARRDLFILEEVGLNDARLVGSRLRVRGDLEDRFGPSIDVDQAEQIEVLAPPPEADRAAASERGSEPPAR